MADDGDLRFKLVKCLSGHWLHDIGCSHDGSGSNQAHCGCGWAGDRLPNVGAAAEQWASHAVEQMRDILAGALTETVR